MKFSLEKTILLGRPMLYIWILVIISTSNGEHLQGYADLVSSKEAVLVAEVQNQIAKHEGSLPLLQCLSTCVGDSRCKSFNFGKSKENGNTTCELLDIDICYQTDGRLEQKPDFRHYRVSSVSHRQSERYESYDVICDGTDSCRIRCNSKKSTSEPHQSTAHESEHSTSSILDFKMSQPEPHQSTAHESEHSTSSILDVEMSQPETHQSSSNESGHSSSSTSSPNTSTTHSTNTNGFHYKVNYRIFSESQQYMDARNTCMDINGTLPLPLNQFYCYQLAQILSQYHSPGEIVLGIGRNRGESHFTYQQSTSLIQYGQRIGNDLLEMMNPTPLTSAEAFEILILRVNASTINITYTTDLQTTRPVICELQQPNAASKVKYIVYTERSSFNEMKDRCGGSGGFLVMPQSQNDASQLAMKLSSMDIPEVYLGIARNISEEHFTYQQGIHAGQEIRSEVKKLIATSSPQHGTGFECLVMVVDYGTKPKYTWYLKRMEDCDDKLPMACEIPNQ